MKIFLRAFLLFSISFFLTGCPDDSSINLFSVDDDIDLGKQVVQEITKNPAEYPILDPVQYSAAYQHLNRIRSTILASGKVKYGSRFAWNCKIIKRDDVVNAFCVPGGDMYFYTGLIKLLDNEAQFAGVMAHEMAHADRRHSTDQLTLAYGFEIIASLILGNDPGVAAEIAAGLAQGLSSLSFSRSNEYEADEYAVKFTYPTEYDAASLGDFFTKLHSQSNTPVFLSTHPSPDDRLAKINQQFQEAGGVHGQTFVERYQQFKASLP
jgi:predicted Zn-dependent protease